MDPIKEQLTDLSSIATVALVAVALGLVFVRLRQPPIVGYILAGVLLGPTGLGYIHQSHAIMILAELGVLLLLFLIGMEISIRAFVMVLRPSVLIAAGQIAAGLLISLLFGMALGWQWPQILLLGFIVAVSSTAVAIKILEDIGELRSEIGRITVGVTVAQDIAIVPMLIVAESFGGEGGFGLSTVLLMLVAITLLGVLVWFLNKPGKIRLPFTGELTGKPDLIALASLAMCLSFATLSSVFGLSPAYGAFVAGLIVANSTLRAEAISVTHPVQSILLFIFFLSIGLLIDLEFILGNWKTVAAFVLVTVAAKTALNVVLIRATGHGIETALPAGLAMAQIGEFSFVLAAAGLKTGAIDIDAYRLALSVIAVTLVISPVWMLTARRFHAITARGVTSLRLALAETLGGDSSAARFAVFGLYDVVLSARRHFIDLRSPRARSPEPTTDVDL